MKRLAALILPLCLLFSACAETPERIADEDIESARSAVAAFNAETRRDTVFRFSVSKSGEEDVMFFTAGNAAVQKEAPIAMSGRITQIEGGAAVTGDMYYKAGAYYYDNGGKYYMIMDRESFLRQFFCADVPFPDSESLDSLRKAESSGGMKYEFEGDSDAESFASMFAEDLYKVVGLRRVDRDKTVYGAASYSYVVNDGALTAVKIGFEVTVYDTAAYYPNYTPTEDELKHCFYVNFELSVTATGSDVNIITPNTEDYTFI